MFFFFMIYFNVLATKDLFIFSEKDFVFFYAPHKKMVKIIPRMNCHCFITSCNKN